MYMIIRNNIGHRFVFIYIICLVYHDLYCTYALNVNEKGVIRGLGEI